MSTTGVLGAATADPLFGETQSKATTHASAAATTSSSANGGSLAVGNLGTTFLNLLVQELQHQDPTAPMDPTATVGQLISLNQLNELISINSALTPATPTTPAASKSSSDSQRAADAQAAKQQTPTAGDAAALDSSLSGAPVAASQATVAAALASQNSAANLAVPLNLNNISGGK